MPETRKPKDRAEILDELLSLGKWTGNELLGRLNKRLNALDEKNINKRTLKRDLEYLESKNAPLHRPVKGEMTYSYTEKFSLKDLPLDPDELRSLKQAITILKKVDNFQMSDELDLIIGKLENKIHTSTQDNQTIVQFENHTYALGSNWYNNLFDSIREQTVLEINYESFKDRTVRDYVVHPYLLKEYRNRWFLLGRNGSSRKILTLGLDRIKKIKTATQKFITNNLFHPDTFFDKVIGVSIDYNAAPVDIILKINPISVPHVESKPIHREQQTLRKEDDGSLIIQLNLMINYELKATILGFGEGIEVLLPDTLRHEIRSTHERCLKQYS